MAGCDLERLSSAVSLAAPHGPPVRLDDVAPSNVIQFLGVFTVDRSTIAL